MATFQKVCKTSSCADKGKTYEGKRYRCDTCHQSLDKVEVKTGIAKLNAEAKEAGDGMEYVNE